MMYPKVSSQCISISGPYSSRHLPLDFLIFEKNNNGLDSVTRVTGKGSIVAFGTSIARTRHDR